MFLISYILNILIVFGKKDLLYTFLVAITRHPEDKSSKCEKDPLQSGKLYIKSIP